MAARQPSELMVAADALAPGQADALVEQAIPALAALLRAHRQAQEASNGVRSDLAVHDGPDRLGGHRLGGGGPQRDGAAEEA